MEGLLDQVADREYTTSELELLWQAGNRVGDDELGHGAHVASIAAGSARVAHEGIAPGSRLLLVKTNFQETGDAVEWVFRKAKDKPTVVNLSFGDHRGAHDGTEKDQRLHQKLAGPGKLIVASAATTASAGFTSVMSLTRSGN